MSLKKEYILLLTCLKHIGVKGIGPQKIFSLANNLTDNQKDVNNLSDLLEIIKSMKEKVFHQIDIDDLKNAESFAKNIINRSEEKEIGYIGFYDELFPENLRNTINEDGKLDPPLLLWYKGNISTIQMPGLAVIGTREPTEKGVLGGIHIAKEFAKRNFNIISGLAIGCDTSAHEGALNGNGKTTAILANGLDYESIYPGENKELAEEIVSKGGLLLSEYFIGTTVNRYNLVARDRLQAGLAKATLVVQTGERGGTMHAAKATLASNKPLFVLRFKDEKTNNDEKCLGNKLLVDRYKAKYISGGDNIDEISDYILNFKIYKESLF